MKQHSGFCCLFGDFKRNLRRQMKRGRQGDRASSVFFRQLRGLNKSLIGITVFLHQIAKPSPKFTQPMFYLLLPAKARPHNPQRGRESAH